MATMKANELLNFGNFTGGDGSYGAFEVSMVEVDAFGTEYNVPLIIDDAFAVVITGFAQEGVDLGLLGQPDVGLDIADDRRGEVQI